MGVRLAVLAAALVVSTATPATGGTSVRWSAGVDMGFVSPYGDSDLWTDGYNAGVSGYWALDAVFSFVGRFGISHWGYRPDDVIDGLVPDGGEITVESSTGSTQLVAFGGSARYAREGVVGSLGGFVQGGGEIVYAKASALTTLRYDLGSALEQFAEFKVDDTRWVPALTALAGLSYAVGDQSWLDLFPSYRAVFDNGTTVNLWALSFGYRMRL